EWLVLHQGEAEEQPDGDLPLYQVEGTIQLEALQDFLRNPLRQFHQLRLKLYLREGRTPPPDAECFELDGLQRHTLRDTLLRTALDETDSQAARQQLYEQTALLQRSGLLPLSGFGELHGAALLEPLPDLLEARQHLLTLWPEAVASPQAVGFQHGPLTVDGWLPGLRRNALGELLSLRVQPGALGRQPTKRKWHHLMRPWVAHLLASAGRVPLHTALLGSDGGLLLAPLPAQTAQDALRALLDAWLRNLQQPLPLAPKT